MHSYKLHKVLTAILVVVLILVLMDDALVRAMGVYLRIQTDTVLILVLMDDALVPASAEDKVAIESVLILVLMDDALVQALSKQKEDAWSLNPCFNG